MIFCRPPAASLSRSACCLSLPALNFPTMRRKNSASALKPGRAVMCVDKRPDELASFATLVAESIQFGPQPWGIVFAAAMSGTLDRAPTSEDAEEPLQRMVEAIKQGKHGAYIPFDPQGHPVQIG